MKIRELEWKKEIETGRGGHHTCRFWTAEGFGDHQYAFYREMDGEEIYRAAGDTLTFDSLRKAKAHFGRIHNAKVREAVKVVKEWVES